MNGLEKFNEETRGYIEKYVDVLQETFGDFISRENIYQRIAKYLTSDIEFVDVPDPNKSKAIGCYTSDGKIRISNKLDEPVRYSACFHELTHALITPFIGEDWSYRVKYLNPLEEIVVSLIEKRMFHTKNKEVLKQIFGNKFPEKINGYISTFSEQLVVCFPDLLPLLLTEPEKARQVFLFSDPVFKIIPDLASTKVKMILKTLSDEMRLINRMVERYDGDSLLTLPVELLEKNMVLLASKHSGAPNKIELFDLLASMQEYVDIDVYYDAIVNELPADLTNSKSTAERIREIFQESRDAHQKKNDSASFLIFFDEEIPGIRLEIICRLKEEGLEKTLEFIRHHNLHRNSCVLNLLTDALFRPNTNFELSEMGDELFDFPLDCYSNAGINLADVSDLDKRDIFFQNKALFYYLTSCLVQNVITVEQISKLQIFGRQDSEESYSVVDKLSGKGDKAISQRFVEAIFGDDEEANAIQVNLGDDFLGVAVENAYNQEFYHKDTPENVRGFLARTPNAQIALQIFLRQRPDVEITNIYLPSKQNSLDICIESSDGKFVELLGYEVTDMNSELETNSYYFDRDLVYTIDDKKIGMNGNKKLSV